MGMMKHSVRPQGSHTAESGKSEQIARHRALELVDEHPFKVRGYDPYDTVAYAVDSKKKDVWQHKSKRL
jgi:hypothetical protein